MSTLLLALLLACSGDDEPGEGTPGEDSGEHTGTHTVPAGPLEVGFARVRMPAPVGIGTAGFGGFGVSGDNTPFQQIYPGTRGIHGLPDLRATTISRGEGHTVIFLRTDMVGVFQQLRTSVVREVEARTGRTDIDDALVIGASHTHSGPGRVIDAGGPFELIADTFFPDYYDALVDAMADAVEQSLADLAPGRMGVVMADGSDSISDRRCEDGLDYVNGSIPVIALEREGELAGLVMAHGIHGTVHGIDELLLSQDVSGGIEAAVSEVVGLPIHVQMFNSWGADIRPDPTLGPEPGEGATLIDGMETIARIGQLVGDDVATALLEVPWEDEPELWTRTLRTPIDRDHIGYDDDTFEFDYGAVYCTAEGDCDPSTRQDNLDKACVPFSEEFPAPNQTEFTVGQVGGLHLVTFPGEPGTLLAEQVLTDVSAWIDGPVMFVGYSQDYLGYSILEDDWWQGGYEASGALWGPRQGEYLAAEVVEAMGEALGELEGDPDRPEPVAPFGDAPYDPYEPATADDVGSVTLQPADAGPTDWIRATVAGEDPWLGTPVATLLHGDGSPVLRADGTPLTSDHPAFVVRLEVDPPWVEDASERRFLWTFEVPAKHPVAGAMPSLSGPVMLQVHRADGTELATTDAATVTP